MYNIEKETTMDIEEVEGKLNSLEETIGKLKELVADAKVCSSEITKTLIFSAVKKYASSISDFKLD